MHRKLRPLRDCVSELLPELKAENSRKDKQVKGLHKVVAGTTAIALCAIMLVVAGFLWYLNQYDFSATAKHFGLQNDVEFFYHLAKDFIEDPDAKPMKVEKYFLD